MSMRECNSYSPTSNSTSDKISKEADGTRPPSKKSRWRSSDNLSTAHLMTISGTSNTRPPRTGYLTVGDRLVDNWIVTQTLGDDYILAQYGQLCFAKHLQTRASGVVKVEPVHAHAHSLANELTCLQLIAKQQERETNLMHPAHRNFAKLITFAEMPDRLLKYVILEKCEIDLYKLRQSMPDRRFSPATALRVALQTLEAVRVVHGLGYLHRDIKPHNLCTASTRVVNNNIICSIKLIDFGTARKWRDYLTGRHVPERTNITVAVGTTRYNSMRAHQKLDKCRTCDIWGILYVTLEMLNPNLPWRALTDDRSLLNSKMSSDYAVVLGPRLAEKCTSMVKLRGRLEMLEYSSEPPYNAIIADLLTDLTHLHVPPHAPYDWQTKPCAHPLSQRCVRQPYSH